jgi:methylated-DNA-protein-cysteine methyltransferase related protein
MGNVFLFQNLYNELMNFKDKVIQIVQKIPEGRVTTYGTISNLAGLPRGARLVGGILHFNSEEYKLPWYRVINRHGFISTLCVDHPKQEQKALLESEGIVVSEDFMIDLSIYGWFGESAEPRGKRRRGNTQKG